MDVVSRRKFLRVGLVVAGAGLLAACQAAPAATPTTAPAKPTDPPKPAASPAAASPAAVASPGAAASPSSSPSPSPSPAASPAAKPSGQAPVAAAPPGRSFTIGTAQFVSHPALDDARKGALRALDESGFKEGQNLRVDAQNGQADMGTVTSIAQRFKDANLDLMLAVGTQPFQAGLSVTRADGRPPIVFNTVTDPYAAARGVVNTATDKPPHVTGIQALPPVEEAMRLVQQVVPTAKRFGIVWNPAEANSEVATRLAREAAGKLGLELIEQSVSKPDEVLQAAQSLQARQIDVFFISTDSTVVSALEAIVRIANENRIPLFGNDPASASRGASAALGIDYEQQGYESGVLAARILSGQATAASLPIEPAKQSFLAINTRAASEQGVTFPDAVMRQVRVTHNEIVPAKP